MLMLFRIFFWGNTMRKLTSFAVVLAACAYSSLAQASLKTGDYVKIYDGPGTGNGGSFLVDPEPAGISNFYTFCLERNEQIGFGNKYYVTIDNAAIFGGYGVADIGGAGVAGVLGSYDPLSPLTAWLYRNAIGGTLAGYMANSVTDNTALQQAIWYIENEDTLPAGLATTYYNAAVAAGPTNLGNVRVMNLWKSKESAYTDGGKVQSQLVTVPEASSIAVWSILGLIGVAVAYRKRSL